MGGRSKFRGTFKEDLPDEGEWNIEGHLFRGRVDDVRLDNDKRVYGFDDVDQKTES